MSLKTWLEEFYPITAAQAVKKGKTAALNHSIQKFKGLLASNLNRHNVKKVGASVVNSNCKIMYHNVITPPGAVQLDRKLHARSIFLAGGISNCNDWQSDLIAEIHKWDTKPVTLINPRRDDFDISNKAMTEEQIKWEFNALRQVRIVTFYFCKETVCPITLFELGGTLERVKNYWEGSPGLRNCDILIYIEPGYIRTDDVLTQVHLFREQMIDKKYIQVFTKKASFELALFDLLDN